MPVEPYKIPILHDWILEPNPWGTGLVLVSYYGPDFAYARVCSARTANQPEGRDVRLALKDGKLERYQDIIHKSIELQTTMHHSPLDPSSIMDQVQTALVQEIAKDAEESFFNRLQGLPPPREERVEDLLGPLLGPL